MATDLTKKMRDFSLDGTGSARVDNILNDAADQIEVLGGQLHDLLASADATTLHEANDSLASGLRQARAENERLGEALITATASLAAAISLLERGGKRAAPSDKMFNQMLADYRKSLDDARAALKQD